MYIHILGSAAGGGLPQWNCNCQNCNSIRAGATHIQARTQSSIAISTDGCDWVLLNTSPDILTQLQSSDKFQPNRGIRDSVIKAIIYVDAQIDHTTGLLMLREGCPHNIYCTEVVRHDLSTHFPIFTMLQHWGGNNINTIPYDGRTSFQVEDIQQLEFFAIALESKAPPYSPHRDDPHAGDNIGIFIKDKQTKKSLFYAPGLYKVSSEVRDFMTKADCLLLDGTAWTDDELIKLKIDNKLISEIGHLPQSGAGGMIEILDDEVLSNTRKILIHINNTNPILDENSKQRQILTKHNIELAYDGMDIIL